MAGPWEDFQTEPASKVVVDRSTGSVERVDIGPWDDFKPQATAQAASGPWDDFKQETSLFSLPGLKSIAKNFPLQIARSWHGAALGGMEELQHARDLARAKGEQIPVDAEETQRLADIATRRRAVELLNQDIEANQPNPSKPLQIASGAVQSIGEMAPFVAAGVLAGPSVGNVVAAAPALSAADTMQYGRTYADSRVPTDVRKQAASIEDSLLNAKVQGLSESAFEILPVSKLIAEVGTTGLSTLVRQYMLREYATEIPTTVAQDMTEWATTEKDMPLGEFLSKVKQDVIDTALTVPLVSAGGGALAHIQKRAGERAEGLVQGPSGEMVPSSENSGVTSPTIQPGLVPDAPVVPSMPKTFWPTPEAQTTVQQVATVDPSTITDEQVEEGRKAMADHAAALVANPQNPQTVQQLSGLNELAPGGDVAELGESAKVARNAKNYVNENDLFDRLERPVLFGPEDSQGLPLGNVELQPGVYTIGAPTVDRSETYLQGLHDTLSDWQQKFLPGRTMLIMNESLPTDSATGWHTQLSSGVHVITPATLRGFKSSETFNTNAQAKVFFNLAHEFGHALVDDRFFEGAPDYVAARVRAEARAGLVSEEAITALPELQQAVVREFNMIKQEVLDGRMTATDFQQRWMNPAKVHKFSTSKEHYVPGTAPATQLVDSIIRRAFRNNVTLGPVELNKLRSEYLGLDEFLAEQTARYAYTRESALSAAPTLQSLIGRALQSVRAALQQFFTQIKGEGVLAPGARFQDWVDSLTKEPTAPPKVGKSKAKAKKTIAVTETSIKELRAKKSASAEPQLVDPQEHNVTSTNEDRAKRARAAVNALVLDGTIERGSDTYKELMNLVKSQDYEGFTELIQPYLESKVVVRFELDDELELPNVGTAFLNDEKYFYHAVRNEEDIPAIFADGLAPRSNISKLKGQAFEDEGGAVLVFPHEEYTTQSKEYQDDALVVKGRAKPVAIFKDISVEFKPPVSESTLTRQEDAAAAHYEELEQKAELYANTLGMSKDDLWKLVWAKDRKALAAAEKANAEDSGVAEAALKLEREQDGVFRELERLEKLRANLKGHSREEIAARFQDLGVPVFLWNRYGPKQAKVRFELEPDLHAAFASGLDPNNYSSTDLVKAERIPFTISEAMAQRPEILADAAREWQQKGFRSKYFKAWFGDWENAPQEASKILTAKGEPLVVFHSTQKDFTTFEYGDIGFHFGTVRAAHNRALQAFFDVSMTPLAPFEEEEINSFVEDQAAGIKAGWEEQPAWHIIPTVLNIRNPFNLGVEETNWWMRPEAMGVQLMQMGAITTEEAMQLNNEIKALRQLPYTERRFVGTRELFAPVRSLLQQKGYDGFVYQNVAEGDVSYVAFEPKQIKAVLGTKTFSKSPQIHWELDFDESKPEGHGAAGFWKKIKPFLDEKEPMRKALRLASKIKYFSLQTQQIAQLAPDLDDVSNFSEFDIEYNTYKSRLQGRGERIAERWTRRLSKEQFGLVNRFMLKEFDDGRLHVGLENNGGTWTYTPNEDFHLALKENGIDVTTTQGQEIATHILEVKNALLDHINETENVLTNLYGLRYGGSPDTLGKSLLAMRSEIHKIRTRPFLPRGDYGPFLLTIEKRKTDGTPGFEVVYRQAFESETLRNQAAGLARSRAKGDERVRQHQLSESLFVLMQFPSDFIDVAASELGLTTDQLDTLRQVMYPVKSEKALKSYDLKRLKLPGGSKDVPRNFANFIWHNANMLAKLQYRAKFNLTISHMKSMLRRAEYSGDKDASRLRSITSFLESKRDLIMSPPHEFHLLRSFVALSYLFLNVKTAAMNLYGLVTTWSNFTSLLGEVEGEKQYFRAWDYTVRSLKLTDLNGRRKNLDLPPLIQQGLDQAIEEGVLTQSYAYHLAGMANAATMDRMPGINLGGKYFKDIVDLGMWVFRLTELATRRVTFLGVFESNLARGLTYKEAYEDAVANTNKLQNSYSLGNTAPLLSGVKTGMKPGIAKKLVEGGLPMLTVFASFAQHAAFHSLGGYELGARRKENLLAARENRPVNPKAQLRGYTMRILILTLLFAGYEGLPFAENLLDFLDAMWKKFSNEPLRKKLREFVQQLGANPVLAAHGLGHNVTVPFANLPGVDVSRSVGFGRVVPGTDVLAKSSGGSYKEDLGNLVLNMMGPTGGLIDWMLRAFSDKENFDKTASRFPGGIGNIITAYQWERDGVRAPSGAQITRDLRTGELRELTTYEIAAKGLGFNPTIVSENREILFNQHDAEMYWSNRRQILMRDHWTATRKQDREALTDVKTAIQEFNEQVPDDYGTLRIRPKDIMQSTKMHRDAMRKEEQGLPRQKRYRGLYRDVRESFE